MLSLEDLPATTQFGRPLGEIQRSDNSTNSYTTIVKLAKHLFAIIHLKYYLSAERSDQMNISAAWDFIDSMMGIDYGYEVIFVCLFVFMIYLLSVLNCFLHTCFVDYLVRGLVVHSINS